MKLLLVEDEKRIAQMLCEILRQKHDPVDHRTVKQGRITECRVHPEMNLRIGKQRFRLGVEYQSAVCIKTALPSSNLSRASEYRGLQHR